MATTQSSYAGASYSFSSERPAVPASGDAPKTESRQASRSLALDWATRPGFGLTPDLVKRIYLEAEAGYPQRQCDLFHDLIENDGHLRGLIEARINAVAGKGWVMQPGGTDSASIEGAQALDELMRTANVHELLWHQLESNFFGWAHSEIDWDFSEGLFYPAWFDNTPHRRFVFPEGAPRLLTDKNYAEGEKLIPGRWVLSRARGSNIARSGLMRTAAWFALFKRTSIRDWVVACEKYGIPFLLGKYDEDTSKKAREELAKALKSLGQDGFGIFEEGITIEAIDVAKRGDGGLLGNLIGLCEAQLSKTITGATLTADASGNGSWALGKVHSGVRFDLIQSDAAMVAEIMRRYIGEPFMRYNGFPGKAPILKSQIAQEIDQQTRMKLQIDAYKLGLPLSKSQLYEDHALRKPIDEADTLVLASPKQSAIKSKAGTQEEGREKVEVEPGSKQPPEGKPGPSKPTKAPSLAADRFLIGHLPYVTVREFREDVLRISGDIADSDLFTGEWLNLHGQKTSADAAEDKENGDE